jgi:hypothetical protein
MGMGYRKLRNISYRHRRQVPGLSDCVLGVVAVAMARTPRRETAGLFTRRI